MAYRREQIPPMFIFFATVCTIVISGPMSLLHMAVGTYIGVWIAQKITTVPDIDDVSYNAVIATTKHARVFGVLSRKHLVHSTRQAWSAMKPYTENAHARVKEMMVSFPFKSLYNPSARV